jgi:DNA-binding HxlR family transcriptional regulator
MANRAYGQFCGFARALEAVGERWALLIVRDLMVSPKRFTDLRRGLPGIPTNILTSRLKELERDGIVERRVLPRPEGSVVYDLTARGRELEDSVTALSRWGAKSLGVPREGEVATADSMAMALRTTFRPEAARGLHAVYEFHFGNVVLGARVDDGKLHVSTGALPKPDVVIETRMPVNPLMSGEISPRDALASERIRVLAGDKRLVTKFADLFRI